MGDKISGGPSSKYGSTALAERQTKALEKEVAQKSKEGVVEEAPSGAEKPVWTGKQAKATSRPSGSQKPEQPPSDPVGQAAKLAQGVGTSLDKLRAVSKLLTDAVWSAPRDSRQPFIELNELVDQVAQLPLERQAGAVSQLAELIGKLTHDTVATLGSSLGALKESQDKELYKAAIGKAVKGAKEISPDMAPSELYGRLSRVDGELTTAAFKCSEKPMRSGLQSLCSELRTENSVISEYSRPGQALPAEMKAEVGALLQAVGCLEAAPGTLDAHLETLRNAREARNKATQQSALKAAATLAHGSSPSLKSISEEIRKAFEATPAGAVKESLRDLSTLLSPPEDGQVSKALLGVVKNLNLDTLGNELKTITSQASQKMRDACRAEYSQHLSKAKELVGALRAATGKQLRDAIGGIQVQLDAARWSASPFLTKSELSGLDAAAALISRASMPPHDGAIGNSAWEQWFQNPSDTLRQDVAALAKALESLG